MKRNGTNRRNFACICFAALTAGLACGITEKTDKEESLTLWERQPNDKILFMSRADRPEGELYLMNKKGMITRLTNNAWHENNPALSPDGKRAAFNRGDEANMLTWEIFTLDLETGAERQLTENGVIDAHPDWSPDGFRIVYGSFRDSIGNPAGTADLYVMNSGDGSGLSRLTDSPWEDNDPEWSPDGNRIAFKSNRDTRQNGREEIFVMASDGSGIRKLTTTAGWQSDHDPSWSPNGDYILFSRFEGERAWLQTENFATDWKELTPWNVHRVDLNGDTERLTDSQNGGWGVALYSEDSRSILFGTIDWILDESDHVIGGLHRMMVMNENGSDPQPLTPDNAHTGTLEYFDW